MGNWRRMDVDGGRPQTSPRLADQPPPPRLGAFSRQRIEPFRRRGERGDRLLGPRPLGRQIGRQSFGARLSGGAALQAPDLPVGDLFALGWVPNPPTAKRPSTTVL